MEDNSEDNKENLRKTDDQMTKDADAKNAEADDAQPERQVSEDDIQEFTKRTGLSVFEASAKTGNGVESSFISLTEALIESKAKTKPATDESNINGGND